MDHNTLLIIRKNITDIKIKLIAVYLCEIVKLENSIMINTYNSLRHSRDSYISLKYT